MTEVMEKVILCTIFFFIGCLVAVVCMTSYMAVLGDAICVETYGEGATYFSHSRKQVQCNKYTIEKDTYDGLDVVAIERS